MAVNACQVVLYLDTRLDTQVSFESAPQRFQRPPRPDNSRMVALSAAAGGTIFILVFVGKCCCELSAAL